MKIAVIGVGTGGLISLSHFCAWTPNADTTIYSIHDPNVSIVGVGESTTPAIPETLFYGTKFRISQDAHLLDATVKHYVKYVNWREHEIPSLINTGLHAMHFNNFKLKDFTFSRLKEIWGEKFQIIHGHVTMTRNVGDKVAVSIDGKVQYFDYIIDCRGYPTDYSDYYISEYIPVNHCLVHTIDKPGNWDYTYHQATKNGWMFGIPLTTRQAWGYLYNDGITLRDEAVIDIAEIFNTTPESLDLKEFSFKNFYAKKILNNRIIKNGNHAMFFEPMEALSGFYYDRVNRFFYDYINGQLTENYVNEYFLEFARKIEMFICYIYHGGSTFDTPFWRITQERTSHKLSNCEYFHDLVNDLSDISKINKNYGEFYEPFSPTSWFAFDENFGYNYFC
jgi:hypothetical protein